MPTSSYMPDVVVQIAFDGGFRVPMADWTWTDVSAYVELAEGITINGGRGDERSTADANSLTLTLDNSDGRFTAGKTSGAYYPDVVLYKPIRVLADPVDGAQSTRFTGYITSWPVEWEDADAYAKATITASSRLARLGLNAAWRSLVEETFLADSPVAYYPLGEPEGSTRASDASGLGADPLVMVGSGTGVVFGQATGPGTDDLTAATFAGGMYLSSAVSVDASGGLTLECYTSRSDTSSFGVFARLSSAADDTELDLFFTSTGTIAASAQFTSSVESASSYRDGQIHHVVATVSAGGTLTLYVNGVSQGTDAGGAPVDVTRLEVGGGGGSVHIGVVAHAAAYDGVLSSTRITAHSTAGSDGFAGELTSDRFERYAAMASIDSAEVNAEAGSTTMVHVDTTGQNVVDLLRTTETTEGGVLYDERDGTLTLHNRAHRYAATAAVTLDMAKQEVEADYRPILDASALANDVTVTNVAGTVSGHLTSPASIEANGVATSSFTTASDDDDEPLSQAGWALGKYATPRTRVPTLTVNALAQVGKTVDCADVMAVTLGDKVTVTNHPTQAAATTTSYFVEGWTEVYGPESLTITWNVSPASPDADVWILGDATYGVLGTTTLLAL